MPLRTSSQPTLGNLIPPQKRICPKCHQRSEYTLRSRPIGTTQRRRYACDNCQTRRTSWELCDEEYQQLIRDQKTLQTILKAIQPSLKASTTNLHTCDQCIHYDPLDTSCSFGFPEAGGTFAAECSTFTPTHHP